ncbi:hypothetical protein FG05_35169 [Fusarium graminearum]|nr:hypothetical protein FG05_35169 [Fusarium graminearum]
MVASNARKRRTEKFKA